jgi:D-alanine-D-alanine ligase
MAERVNLVVLFGGQSAEHDVSCVTAAHVLRAVDPEKYAVTAVGISRDGAWQVAEGAMAALATGPAALPGRLAVDGPATSAAPILAAAAAAAGEAPVVVLPLLHGPLGEDGTVQGLLELAGVPYVGSGVLASSVSMDKAMAKLVLAQHGFTQAAWVSLREDEVTPTTAAAVAATLGLPVFVKPANMGSSVGVRKAKTVEELRDAITFALQYDEWIVIEEAVVGREIEVAVLGNRQPRASVPGEIVPGNEFYDYEDKYLEDGSQLLIPAPLTADQTAEVRELAVRAFAALRCDGLARVDFFLDTVNDRWVINEINTIPGFTPISMYPKMWQASGVSYSELIDELVRLALERAGWKRRNTER